MRRWIISLLCLSMLFTSCGKREKQPTMEEVSSAVSRSFDAKATIKMGGIEAEVDINRTQNGACTFAMTKPQSLEGLSLGFAGETLTLSYRGISLDLDSEAVLTSAMTKAVIGSINKAAEPNGVRFTVSEAGITIDGTSESGDFTLLLSREDYSILSLSVPDLEFECRFDLFSYVE